VGFNKLQGKHIGNKEGQKKFWMGKYQPERNWDKRNGEHHMEKKVNRNEKAR